VTASAAVSAASLARLATPLLTIDLDDLDANITTMAAWCTAAGVNLAPHGKTTMAPDIWRRQIDAGAWGITVATASQAAVAREVGVERVILAGTSFRADTLLGLAAPGSSVLMWVDSVASVRLIDDLLAGARAPLAVLVEFGSPLGRTGARTANEALAVVAAVSEARHLVFAGIAGYEGALTHGLDDDSLAVIDDYLTRLLAVFDAVPADACAEWIGRGGDIVLTAGGSVYFDRVAAILAERHDPEGLRGARTRVVLRSGAYVTHDHGLYERLTPFARPLAAGLPEVDGAAFSPALELWATVISRPEPGLALLDFGRRDAADDEGLPRVLDAWRPGERERPLDVDAITGARVSALNDQHAFLRLDAAATLRVGDLVRLGISHPCTTIDKWREIATVRGGTKRRDALPMVDGVIGTRF
jgi:D-serine deaminase-like pyridoxal phosphate-dependent protein